MLSRNSLEVGIIIQARDFLIALLWLHLMSRLQTVQETRLATIAEMLKVIFFLEFFDLLSENPTLLSSYT